MIRRSKKIDIGGNDPEKNLLERVDLPSDIQLLIYQPPEFDDEGLPVLFAAAPLVSALPGPLSPAHSLLLSGEPLSNMMVVTNNLTITKGNEEKLKFYETTKNTLDGSGTNILATIHLGNTVNNNTFEEYSDQENIINAFEQLNYKRYDNFKNHDFSHTILSVGSGEGNLNADDVNNLINANLPDDSDPSLNPRYYGIGNKINDGEQLVISSAIDSINQSKPGFVQLWQTIFSENDTQALYPATILNFAYDTNFANPETVKGIQDLIDQTNFKVDEAVPDSYTILAINGESEIESYTTIEELMKEFNDYDMVIMGTKYESQHEKYKDADDTRIAVIKVNEDDIAMIQVRNPNLGEMNFDNIDVEFVSYSDVEAEAEETPNNIPLLGASGTGEIGPEPATDSHNQLLIDKYLKAISDEPHSGISIELRQKYLDSIINPGDVLSPISLAYGKAMAWDVEQKDEFMELYDKYNEAMILNMFEDELPPCHEIDPYCI